MRRLIAHLLVVLIGTQPALLHGQQGPTAQGKPAAKPATADVLAASFERVRKALAESPPSENVTPLKLDYYVEVVGQAPAIQLFTPQDLAGGPVPGTAPPTHQDMLGVMTPEAFRAGSVPISTLAIMGVAQFIKWQRAAEKRRQQEEAEKKRQQDEAAKKLAQPSVVIKAP
jgi:hypothetical protein